jgi:hypothetical protein
MAFKIVIQPCTSAFDDGNLNNEIARILRELADRIENDDYPSEIVDVYGTPIGKVENY